MFDVGYTFIADRGRVVCTRIVCTEARMREVLRRAVARVKRFGERKQVRDVLGVCDYSSKPATTMTRERLPDLEREAANGGQWRCWKPGPIHRYCGKHGGAK